MLHRLFFLAALLLLPVLAQQTATPPPLSPELAEKKSQAAKLLSNAQFMNALPLYEQLAKEAPDDAEVQYGLALCSYGKAKNNASPEEAAALLNRARTAAARAQQLGYKSDLLTVLISALNGQSGPSEPSQNPQANQKMKEGETAFGRGDNEAAIAAYAAALQLDPKLYTAALFAGDACFRKKDIACASEWFSKAVAIDPDTETAHRYWGDALMAAGKADEARDQFVEAIISNPYAKQTWASFSNWSKKTNTALTDVRINRPAVSDDPQKIVIDSGSLTESDTGREAWMTYSIVRGGWRMKIFPEKHPQQKYRHTLEEEEDALHAVAGAINHAKAKNLDPQLALLEKLVKQKMLAPWILLNGADQGIAQDYAAYRAAHRDLLRRYLVTFVIQPASAH